MQALLNHCERMPRMTPLPGGSLGRGEIGGRGNAGFGKIRLPLDHHRTSEKNCSNSSRNSSGGPSLPSDITGVATCAHHPPANSALLPLRDGGDDGARYVRFRGEPDIAGDVVQLLGTSGKNTGPRREHPQLSDAARNPGFYDFRRQGATLDAALDLVPLSHFCTSAKNCWNSPSSSSGGPSRPSLMRGVATYFSRSIFQPRMVAPLKPGLPCGPWAPRSPFSPAAPRLPWLASSCQPEPGQGPGASSMKLPPLR